MDMHLIKKYVLLTAAWFTLFLAIIVTDAISRLTTFHAWIVYSSFVGFSFVCIKLWNRKQQEPLLDVELNYMEMSISVALAVLVSLFGAALLQFDFITSSFEFLLFAFVMTKSQFTLIKSVQPDPASPTHGFNRVVSLSSPIYFCLLAIILLACETYSKSTINNGPNQLQNPSLVFYSFDFFDKSFINLVGQTSLMLLLSFPVIFVFGLLPQITTFIIYILEHIDIHFFGSTAATLGIKSAAYSFIRSLLAISVLYLIALQSLSNQHLFSLFCGLLISIAYLLSRNSSDATIAFRISKRILSALNPAKRFERVDKIELDDLRHISSSRDIPPRSLSTNSVSVRIPDPTNCPISTTNDEPQPSTSSASTTSEDESTAAINSQETTLINNIINLPNSISVVNDNNNTNSGLDSVVIDSDENSTINPSHYATEATNTTTNGDDSNNNINCSSNNITNNNNNNNINQQNDNDNNHIESNENNDISNSNANVAGDNNVDNNNCNTLDREDKNSDTLSISTRIQSTIDDICVGRLKKDLIICLCATIVVFILHVTTVFNAYQEQIELYVGILAIIWGILFHFVIPQLRRDIPCMCLAKPVLKPREYKFFEVKTKAKLMWYERVHFVALAVEKNLIYPIFWLNVITKDSSTIKDLYGQHIGPLILVIVGLKLVRSSFNDSSANYLVIIFAQLFFKYDVAKQNYHIFSINYFLFSILQLKLRELLLKLQFIYVYIAPWQIPWGSAFHAFAQPFSVPHSTLLFCQAILSSILSAPLQPLLGSAIFIMSYVRPVKFWERDYNTNVIDINSTRLVTQLERNRIDSNRLDGVFYEHLTKCLQRKLCRDLSLGRWGPVSQGDCFIMASDNLNCLVHIIEFGNGVCTFQLRGLEFRGTYCQQQEVEAITEGVSQDERCCCCDVGRLPSFLSANAAFNQLWLAWHVTHTRYVLEGYSISDNHAGPMLQPFDLRRALITYYVKAIIYFTVTSNHLSKWLRTTEFHEALEHTKDKKYADLDPTFSLSLDLDFDFRLCGVTRAKFCSVYFDWIKYCVDRVKHDKKDTQRADAIADLECNPDSFLVSLCYGLSLLARRFLSAVADGQQFHTVESLLFGLHALLKGDFRITSLHDEWIFQEMRFFKLVVIPAVRMSLKLHQDHFTAPDDYEDNMYLFEAIAGYQKNLVISHETDVAWRTAVLSGVPSLLTLRLYTDDGSNQYKFIMLNRRYLSFRIIKINRECVRGLWASQQQELIFFRNTDPERGSIQNAKQVLRNMINSSCDQPVGYPIYVSPLTTSYFECGSLSSFVN